METYSEDSKVGLFHLLKRRVDGSWCRHIPTPTLHWYDPRMYLLKRSDLRNKVFYDVKNCLIREERSLLVLKRREVIATKRLTFKDTPV